MSVCFRPTSHQDEGELTSLSLSNLIIDFQAFASVVALVAAATGAPVANLLAGGHAGLVGGHGLVSGPGAFVGGHGLVGGPGLVGGHGLVGGVGHAVVGVGGGQVSHQSVHKPLQGENRGVTQSKAFGSPVAAVADHPSTTHGVGSNRVRTVGVVSSGLVGHGVVGGLGHGVAVGHGVGVGHGFVGGVGVGHGVVGHGVGVGHGLVGGAGLGVGGVYNGYTGYNGTPFLNAALLG